MYSRFESRKIADNIGYIAFSVFFDPMTIMKAFGDAVRSFMDADGIIIDVRGNPGGIGAMAIGMSGWLVDSKNQYLGTMKTRDTELKFVVNPRVETYQGPVAVLVDELSGSTTEIFTGGLQDLGRARILGSRTAGAVLPSAIVRLPNGDGFQYAFANYVSASGKVLEGDGVTPDQEVVHTRDALLAGRDLVMEEAVEWIHGQE
jgi:carboxyl-terminal processing protease